MIGKTISKVVQLDRKSDFDLCLVFTDETFIVITNYDSDHEAAPFYVASLNIRRINWETQYEIGLISKSDMEYQIKQQNSSKERQDKEERKRLFDELKKEFGDE